MTSSRLGDTDAPMLTVPRSLLIVVCLVCTTLVLQGEDNDSMWPPLPEAMLKDAEAAMFINRPRELIGNMEKSATEAAVAIDDIFQALANQLYRSRNLDGIDQNRPAMLLWRKGRAPLLGIIPISNREKFLKSFGKVVGVYSQMTRVAENAGTTVYKQNTEDGLIEYRLLIRDQTAYLGRSAAECNLLSELKLQEEPSAPMYRFYIDNPYDFLPRIENAFGQTADPLLAEINNLIAGEWDLLLQQVKNITVEASVDVKQNLSVKCKILPIKESTLALWTDRQQNQSSRLLSLLDFDKSSVAIYGNISWAGGIKETAIRIAKFIERYSKSENKKTIAKALSSWGALFDRQAAFAQCLHLRSAEDGVLDIYGIGVQEQARSLELIGYQQILENFMSEKIEEQKVKVGDLGMVEGQQAYWKTTPFVGESKWEEVFMATDAHMIESWGMGERKVISKRASGIVEKLDKSVSPIGNAGIVVVHMKLHNILREISNLSGGIGYKIEDAEISMAMSMDNDRRLVFGLDFPLTKVAKSIRASDWTAVVQKLESLLLENLTDK